MDKRELSFLVVLKVVIKNISPFQNHIKDPTSSGVIRALTDSVLEQCIEKTTDSYTVNRTKLDKCSLILAQFIDVAPEREVQCLNAVKRKIVELEHPSNCFQEILSCFYDNFLLTKEGFNKWREDNDPLEQEGKGERRKLT